ncbi:MAG: Thymidylate kinase [Legionellaceae bacterium]
MKAKKAYFFTLEGIEGVGKSTNLNYIESYLRQKGIDLVVTREPGGTAIAESIRQIFLLSTNEKMLDETELLLLFAARNQHIKQVIEPALAKGQWVLCDRFIDASFAYQGYGRGIPLEKITYLENWIQKSCNPDLTILLDASVDVAIRRTKRRRGAPDRIEVERKAFFHKVRLGYLQRAKENPSRYRVINAAQSRKKVIQEITRVIEDFFHE